MVDDGLAIERLSLEELIVEQYLIFLERETGSINWAWSVLEDLLGGLPERGWPLLREIIRRAPDRALDYLGAGPLESLLMSHGAQVIDAIELEAQQSPNLRLALGGIYPHAIAESVRQRVIALIPDGADAALRAVVPSDRRSVRIDVGGRPPTRPGSRSRVQIARRDALLDAFIAANGDRLAAWTTPVRLDIDVDSGPEIDPTGSAGDILQGVIETLALDRPDRLVTGDRRSHGLVSRRSIIRGGEVRSRQGREASYVVWAYRMHEGEPRA